MKARLIILSFFLFSCLAAFCQNDSRKLFTVATEKYILSSGDVQKLFGLEKGQSGAFHFLQSPPTAVTINMNVANDATTRTIGGVLSDYPDAYFTITSYQDKGQSLIAGELISKKDGTAFKIYVQADGNICFERLPKERIIVEN